MLYARFALLLCAAQLSIACDPSAMGAPDGSSSEDSAAPSSDSSATNDATNGSPVDSGAPIQDAGAAPPSASSLLRVGFYDQHLAVGPDQRIHLTFVDGAAERVHYAECSQRCGDLDSWTSVQLLDIGQLGVTTVGPYGLVVDASGRAHMITSAVARLGSVGWQVAYGTCASNCTVPRNWTFVDLAALAPNLSLIGTTDTLMVNPAGQVSFVSANYSDSQRPVFFQCDSNCTNAASWRVGLTPITGQPTYARQDSTGVTHVMFAGGRTSAGEQLIQYARCARGCTTASNWQVSMMGFLTSMPVYESGFAIDARDRLFLTYNQGEITQGTESNKRNVIASCAGSNCLALDTWQSATIGQLEEGDRGQSIVPVAGGGLAMTTAASFSVHYRRCESNCVDPSSWSEPSTIDTSDAIAATIAPDTASACAGRSESAAWWPRMPMTAVNNQGFVVVHNPYAIVKCPGDPNPDRMPPIGRVIASY